MYRSTYAAIAEDDSFTARSHEHRALDEAVSLLEEAKRKGPLSVETTKAIHYIDRLWRILLEDLASDANGLPRELRAQLISIGLWSMREAEAIRTGRSDDLDSMIDVSKIIRDSLA